MEDLGNLAYFGVGRRVGANNLICVASGVFDENLPLTIDQQDLRSGRRGGITSRCLILNTLLLNYWPWVVQSDGYGSSPWSTRLDGKSV